MTTISSDRPIAAPQVDPANADYFARARDGVLATRACQTCGKLHWYPRPVCPFCQGDTEWRDVSGLGTIYSVSVTRRAGPIPYAIAYVALDEGVTMLTNIVDCDLDQLKIGQRVRVVFKPAEDGTPLAMFRPA